MNNKYIETLNKAKDILKTEGWCKGSYTDGAGHYCALGALAKACDPYIEFKDNDTYWSNKTDNGYNDWVSVVAIVKEHLPTSFVYIDNYNDAKNTTLEDIIKVIDNTISKFKESNEYSK